MARRKRLPVALRESEAKRLLSVAYEHTLKNGKRRRIHMRNYLIVRTFFGAGLRVSELVNMGAEDLDLDRLDRAVAYVVAGKGDKDRNVPIPKTLAKELKAWLNGRRSGTVFGDVSVRQVQVMIKGMAKQAKIRRLVTPHKLRHTYATRLLESGADIRVVQELLGHASVSTTEIYLSVTPERTRAAVEKLDEP